MAHLFELGRDGLTIDGRRVEGAEPLGWYAELLGPTTIRTGVPEIARLRPDLSNKWHVFDELGIVLNEDHARKLVYSVVFPLVPEPVEPRPAQAFAGELRVFGQHIQGRETERELEQRGLHPDRAFLHQWSYELGPFSVSLDFKKLRRTDRPWLRSPRHHLVAVHFGILTPEHRALVGR